MMVKVYSALVGLAVLSDAVCTFEGDWCCGCGCDFCGEVEEEGDDGGALCEEGWDVEGDE